MRRLIACLILLSLLSGCTNADLVRFLATPIAPAPANTIDPALASRNRLLVQGADGNLFTISPDGTTRFDLTTDAGRTRAYTQATWSSSGERIGWTVLEQTAAGLQSTLITSRADGSERTQAETLFPPFYLYWSPDDSKLAYLSNWLGEQGQTIALQLVNIAGGGDEAITIGTGQPLYFSWAPTSEKLITHAANQRVALVTLGRDDVQVLTEASANFAAPQWSTTGEQLLFVTAEETVPQLVLTDVNGENPQLITNLSREDAISLA
ncbi:MAG: hypothetical protein R3E79_27130 [Caldilineaceae bacterium]